MHRTEEHLLNTFVLEDWVTAVVQRHTTRSLISSRAIQSMAFVNVIFIVNYTLIFNPGISQL